MMICVYGTFNDKDMRIKTYEDCDSRPYVFQNIMRDAGYDAELFSVPDPKQKTEPDIGNLYRAYVRDEDGMNILIHTKDIKRAEELARKYFETDSVSIWRMIPTTDHPDIWKDEE